MTLREDASRNFGVTGRRGALFLLRLARSGVSQTSNGGLENGIHTQAVSWGGVMICLYLDILLLSTPLSHHLVGRNLSLLPGQETLGTTPKE